MSHPLSPRGRRWLGAALAATLVAHGLWAALETVTATDLYWAMATGRWIVTHGEIPRGDVFSFTYAGAPWSNQEWLSQVLFYELWTYGGGTAVALFRVGVIVTLVALAAWLGWRRGASPVFAVIMACGAAYVCRPNLDIRPQLFQFLGTLVVIGLVDAYRRGASPRLLLVLPLLMALWVNTHFSFIYGLGVLGLLAGVEIGKALLALPDALDRRRALRLGAAALAGALACLLNPQGFQALVSPFSLLGSDELWRRQIIEWAPPVLFEGGAFSSAFLGYYLVAQAVLAVAVLVTQPRRFDLTNGLHVATTAVMALSARRFGPLFALVAAPFGALNLAILARSLGWEMRRAWQALAVGAACLGIVGLLGMRAVTYDLPRYRAGLFTGMSQAWMFPRDAVDFLNRNPLPARLAHIYQWGGYVMFNAPTRPVFIDGRGHLVYPGEFYLEYNRLEYGEQDWRSVLDRYQISLVLWPSSGLAMGQFASLLQQLRRASDWRCVYDDGQAAVFAHTERGRAWTDAYDGLRLEYPDTLAAQLFLADAYFRANEFERTRLHMLATFARFHATPKGPSSGEQQLLVHAETTGSAVAWFHLAMTRDVRDDVAGATAAYQGALARGLGEPQAAYAHQALARLAPGS